MTAERARLTISERPGVAHTVRGWGQVVRGQVQGVGFRWWVREQAATLGLAGSADNLSDGSVEIVLEGARSHCADLLERVQGSSTPGRVRSTTHRWGTSTAMTGFTVR